VRTSIPAAASGSTASSTPTWNSAAWPNTNAHSAAVTPAARKERPRVVSPRSAARTPLARAGRATPAALRARDRQSGHQVEHDLLDRAAAQLGLRGRQQAVRQHRGGEHLDVVREHVVAALQGGVRAGRPDEVQGGPGGGAEPQLGAGAGGGDQVDGVAADRVGDVDGLHQVDQLEQVGGVRDRLQVVQRVGRGVQVEHRELGLGAGVADRDPGHEAVALGLGQGVGALHLHRVLGGDHHERRGQLVGGAVDGDLALLHRLQQRGLGLRRGPVDLVADHDLREDRARPELEVALVLVEHVGAGHVGRQQVGRELDAAHRAVHRAGQRLGEHGLADARHVLQQQVALGEEHRQGDPDRLRLALDHAFHGLPDPVDHRRQLRHPG